MRTITPTQALEGKQYAIVARDGHVYDIYETKDEACRICKDLVARYGDGSYYAAAIDFGEAQMEADKSCEKRNRDRGRYK